jgi:hypothetical protein
VTLDPLHAAPQPQVQKAIAWMKRWTRINAGWLIVSLACLPLADRFNTSPILIFPLSALFFVGIIFCFRVKSELQAGKTELALLGKMFCWFAIAGGVLAMSNLLMTIYIALTHQNLLDAAIALGVVALPAALIFLCHRTSLALQSAIGALADPSQTRGFPLVEETQSW